MRRQALGGTAMIIGAIMGIVVMVLHPTGHAIVEIPGGQGLLNLAVHSFAIASLPIAFYGALALTRVLAEAGEPAELGLAFYGGALVAAMIAATASGFLTPSLLMQVASADGKLPDSAVEVLRFSASLNRAFAKLLVAGSSLAIGLWSVQMLHSGVMRRGSAVYGCVIAVVALLALLSGHLPLNVHGFGAVVIGQAVWLLLVGFELRGTVWGAAAPQ